MRRSALLLILLLVLSLVAVPGYAVQIEHLTFEGLYIISDTTTASATLTYDDYNQWRLIKSITISEPNEKYLAGVKFKVYAISDGTNAPDYVDWKVEIVGSTTQSKTERLWGITNGEYGTFDELFNVSGTTFTINIYAKNPSPYDDTTIDVQVLFVYAYVIDDRVGGIKTNFLDRKYIPPGAEGTEQGFILNETELYLSQPVNLSEGSVAFWLKWDGTKGISISDNIGIDTSGYIYIKNNDGVTYTLEGVSPPVGQYVPVYIAWESGYGYIMLNTTKITLNWAGNLTITKIGSITNNTATIIDEFRIWDTYIPPDQIIYEAQGETYYLFTTTGEMFPIQPEGGNTLGILNVALLSSNFSTINTTTLSPTSKTYTMPAGTQYVVVSRQNTERLYYMANLTPTTLAFPADTDVTLQVVTLTIYPPSYKTLEVWTLDEKLAFRTNITESTSTTFTALYGNYYKFVVYAGNYSFATIQQINSDRINLKFPKPDAIFNYEENQEKMIVKKSKNIVTITYISPQVTTANLTILGYDQNNRVVLNVTDTITSQGFVRQVVMGDDISSLRVEIKTPTYSAVRIVQNKLNFSYLIPENIFPNGLRIIFFGSIGIFLVARKNKELSCLGGFVVLSLMNYIQLAQVPEELLIILAIGSAAGLMTASEEVPWI